MFTAGCHNCVHLRILSQERHVYRTQSFKPECAERVTSGLRSRTHARTTGGRRPVWQVGVPNNEAPGKTLKALALKEWTVRTLTHRMKVNYVCYRRFKEA